MTIEVVIHNKDKSKTVEIFTREFDKSRLSKTENHLGLQIGIIKPEGQYTTYLHLLKDLVLKEQAP